ncbi:MAG: glycosyltransferase, partial [Thermoplasmata archaeon]
MISIVVPVYNEKDNIKPLYEKIKETLDDFEIIFVDDGSNDGTYEEIKKLHDIDNRIKCI